MIESTRWLSELILSYPAFKYGIVFLGAAFGGEPAVITLAFLAAHKIFPLGAYFFSSFAGVLFADSLYYFLGKTKLVKKMIEHRYAKKPITAVVGAIDRLSRGRHMIAFVLAKFVIGTRAVIIMYVSKTGISFGYFLRHNLPGIVFWLLVVSGIGYFSGLGFAYFSGMLQNIYAGVGFLLLVLLVLIIVQSKLKKAFEKEEEEIIQEENMI